MKFEFNKEKNLKLLKERNIGFEGIIQAISEGNLLAIRQHYNWKKYPNQKILYVQILDKVYVVPYTEKENDVIFLKTLFPSRKAKKMFLKNFKK